MFTGIKETPNAVFFFNKKQARDVALITLHQGTVIKEDFNKGNPKQPTQTKVCHFEHPTGSKNGKLCYSVVCVFFVKNKLRERDIITSFPIF